MCVTLEVLVRRRTLSWKATGGWTAGVRDCGGTGRSVHSGGARREAEAG